MLCRAPSASVATHLAVDHLGYGSHLSPAVKLPHCSDPISLPSRTRVSMHARYLEIMMERYRFCAVVDRASEHPHYTETSQLTPTAWAVRRRYDSLFSSSFFALSSIPCVGVGARVVSSELVELVMALLSTSPRRAPMTGPPSSVSSEAAYLERARIWAPYLMSTNGSGTARASRHASKRPA